MRPTEVDGVGWRGGGRGSGGGVKAAAAIEGNGGGVATAGPGVARRLRGSVGRGDSLDVLYSATTVTTGRSLRKRFVSMRRAAPLHACPPHPLAVWSACVLLISDSVFIVYVHSAPQSAKTLDLERVERSLHSSGFRTHFFTRNTREPREVVRLKIRWPAQLSPAPGRARIAYLSTL